MEKVEEDAGQSLPEEKGSAELTIQGRSILPFQGECTEAERIEENKKKIAELLQLVKFTKMHEQTKEALLNEQLDKSSNDIKNIYKLMLQARLMATLSRRNRKALFRCFRALRARTECRSVLAFKQKVLRRELLSAVLAPLKGKPGSEPNQRLTNIRNKLCANLLSKLQEKKQKSLREGFQRLAIKGNGNRINPAVSRFTRSPKQQAQYYYRPLSPPRYLRVSSPPRMSSPQRNRAVYYGRTYVQRASSPGRQEVVLADHLFYQNRRLREQNQRLRSRILASKSMLQI